MTEWQPIASAPKAWVYEYKANLPLNMTTRAGRCIKVRGEYQGQMEEFAVHWAQVEAKHMDQTPHWFVCGCEPLDWPVTEWRELTNDEQHKVDAET